MNSADDMHAGGVDVLEIFAVALIADRAEAFRHNHLGETGNGIKRRANFVTDFADELRFRRRRFLRFARGRPQLVLAFSWRLQACCKVTDFVFGRAQRKRCRLSRLCGSACNMGSPTLRQCSRHGWRWDFRLLPLRLGGGFHVWSLRLGDGSGLVCQLCLFDFGGRASFARFSPNRFGGRLGKSGLGGLNRTDLGR